MSVLVDTSVWVGHFKQSNQRLVDLLESGLVRCHPYVVMNKTVRYEVDLNHLPPLMAAQKAELKALSELPDSDIDYSEIAPLDEAFWQNAVQNPFYKPTKTSTTVRVDSDVLVWLKSQGKGYQTRMNAILHHAMLRALHPKA
jgi:uncharacterized protein (DUF4415 family)